MVEIDVTCHLEAFRRFLINSTCRSFIPESYLRDPEVFPEKEADPGSIYIEAADKVTLKKLRDITFINARDILGIIYTSKSGNSRLKWRQMRGPLGRVTGTASTNSLVNLSMSRIITPEYVEEVMRKAEQGGVAAAPTSTTDGAQETAESSGEGTEPESRFMQEAEGIGEEMRREFPEPSDGSGGEAGAEEEVYEAVGVEGQQKQDRGDGDAADAGEELQQPEEADRPAKEGSTGAGRKEQENLTE
jgi:hypothetical protein